MYTPQPGIRVGVPHTRSLLSPSTQSRQFEYHPTQTLLGVGTIRGEVVVTDWKDGRQLGKVVLPGAIRHNAEPLGRYRTHHKQQILDKWTRRTQILTPVTLHLSLPLSLSSSSVLALSWLRHSPDRLLAGCSFGSGGMFQIDPSKCLSQDELHDDTINQNKVVKHYDETEQQQQQQTNAITLKHAYQQPLTEQLTSLHCNADDTLLCASGYTHSVNVLDLETGIRLRRLQNIHQGHINIARFANGLPYLLLTCSFDRKLNMFDLRCNNRITRDGIDSNDPEGWNNASSSPVPIYTCESKTGCVMVCFAPNDLYFLSSAVDNEVKQWQVVDGKLNLEYAIPKQNLKTNYTRSYYMNEGESVISGSSASDLLYVCSSVDGQVLDTVDMSEARQDDNLYIQSLRGCPMPEHHNRAAVLVCYRKQPIITSYELIEVNLNVNPNGHPRDHPLSLSSIIHMSDDYRQFLNHRYGADVVISCEGASGDQLIYAHHAMLHSRWPWFAKHVVWNAQQQQQQQQQANDDHHKSTPTSTTTHDSNTTMRDSGSLDDDEDEISSPSGDTPMVDVSGESSHDKPIVFCRIVVPHPPNEDGSVSPSSSFTSSPSSSVSHASHASSSSASDIITISSTGMVSLQFPRLSRTRMLYLLEYLYTGTIPLESYEDARLAAANAAAAAKATATHLGSKDDTDRRSTTNVHVGPPPSSDGFGSLDDDAESLEPAVNGSLSHSHTTLDSLDVHAALIDLSRHATPSTAFRMSSNGVSDLHSSTSFQVSPLSSRFDEKLQLYRLASSKWYHLPRLANILERSMRKQMKLAWSEFDQTMDENYHHQHPYASSQSSSSSSSSSSSTASRSPALLCFLSRLGACVRLGATGLVSVGQDLIERSFDWLSVSHPWFIHDELPRLFPSTHSNFLIDLHQRREACLKEVTLFQAVQTSFAMVDSGDNQGESLVIWAGGTTQKTTPPFGPLHTLHTTTLRMSDVACEFDRTSLPPYEDGLACHASCIIRSSPSSSSSSSSTGDHGHPSHLLVFGGQSTLMENRLHVLDLSNLSWSVKDLPSRPRPRKKHTLTNVHEYKRAYVFGGRDQHHVFGDVFYFDYSDPNVWTVVNVQEQHQLNGRTNLINPAVRFSHSCTYSRTVGGIILFGGTGVAGGRNDVWLFDPSTNLWTNKVPNNPHLTMGTSDQYLQSLADTPELVPLPRLGHAACIVHVDGVDCLAIFGGIAMFEVGQLSLTDLWLLNLTDWSWRKMEPISDRPIPPPVNLDAEVSEQNLSELLQRTPTGRWEHSAFAQHIPGSDVNGTTCRFAVLGGTMLAQVNQSVPWIDVFDFTTRRWERCDVHPTTQQPQPTINIEDEGCMWIDMQRRFRQTQPEPFTQPMVDEPEYSMVTPAAVLHPPGVGPIATASLSACIEYNMSFERSLYSHPTPLPSCSFIHFLVEGRVLTLPKVILVSRCPTFLSMITSHIRDENIEQKNLIIIEGVRYIIFRCIIYFIYCGDEEFIIDIKNHSLEHLQQRVHRLRRSGSSTGSSSPYDSSSSLGSVGMAGGRGTKRSGDDLSDSDDSISLGGLDLDVSNGSSKKLKNGHTLVTMTPHPVEEGSGGLEDLEPMTITMTNGATSTATATASSSSFIDTPFPSSIVSSTYTVDPLEIQVAADRFNLTSLCSVLEIGLSRQIEIQNVAKFLGFAEVYNLQVLTQRCIIFIIQHYEEVTTSHAAEYSCLTDSTRTRIDDLLHSLAGSHRGPRSRNEPTPLKPPTPNEEDQPSDEEADFLGF